SAILQTILAVVDRGVAADEAVGAPRLHVEGEEVEAEPGIDPAALDRLGGRGWRGRGGEGGGGGPSSTGGGGGGRARARDRPGGARQARGSRLDGSALGGAEPVLRRGP